jgi:hypothetical protein
MLNSEKKENRLKIFLLLSLLLVGIVIRVWHIGQMHYTNDELSALSRTQFSSIDEVVEKGVIPDGHPVLVQVFLYYWAHWFDYEDVAVKIPFIIAGILSLILMFFIAKDAGGWYSGLFVVAFAMASQPFVYFSQVARPYAPGLLFTLSTVFFVQKILIKKQGDIKWFFAAAVSLVLTYYTHYFAALTTTLFWIMAFFVAPRKLKVKFIAYGLLAALLFLPHLPITLTQLSYGGLKWLSTPSSEFYKYLVFYPFNYNILLLILSIGIFLFSLLYIAEYKRLINKTLLFFFPFLLTLIVGGLYSVYRMPVLQFSVLLFSYAFLVIFLFVFVKNIDKGILYISIPLIAIIGWYSLVFERQHFKAAYDNPFYKVAKFYHDNKGGNNHLPIITIAYHKFYVGSYVGKLDKEVDTSKYVINFNPSFSIEEFQKLITTLNADSVVIGYTTGLCKLYMNTYLRHYYPVLSKCSDYAYLFVKSGKNCKTEGTYVDTVKKYVLLPGEKYNSFWKNVDNAKIEIDSATGEKYFLRTEEWGISFSAKLKELVKEPYNVLISSAVVRAKGSENNVKLVSEIKDTTKKTLWWNSNKVNFYHNKAPVAVCAYMIDINTSESDYYKTYLWNIDKDTIEVFNQSVFVLRGKPQPYLVFYPKDYKK